MDRVNNHTIRHNAVHLEKKERGKNIDREFMEQDLKKMKRFTVISFSLACSAHCSHCVTDVYLKPVCFPAIIRWVGFFFKLKCRQVSAYCLKMHASTTNLVLLSVVENKFNLS